MAQTNRHPAPASLKPNDEQNNMLARIPSQARRSTIMDHFKDLAVRSGKQSGQKVHIEVLESEGVRHVSTREPVRAHVEIVDEKGVHGFRHLLARLYETSKKVVQKGEEILGGSDDTVIHLGPEEDAAARPVPIPRRKRPARAANSLDEYLVQGKIKFVSSNPVATGGFCEVFRGQFYRKGQKSSELVAMKRINPGTTPEHERKIFRRETNAWNKLHHANILPFYGTILHKNRIYMISPWADNGELITYLKEKNPAAPRRPLLVQIANALSYIHNECKIVHGDIKGANIFVSAKGEALIADFGLATRVEKLPGVTATGKSVAMAMTPRFSAPELLIAAADAEDPDGKVVSSIKSRASDVYAFGQVILQVYTLERPWPQLNTERVYAHVLQGFKPKRPPEDSDAVARGLDQFMWDIVERCLETKPANRPCMADIAASLTDGSIPRGAADLSGEIIGQHKESQLLVARRRQGGSGEQVVLKMPVKGNKLQVQKVVQHQIQSLSLIQHPNILPLYGTAEIGSHMFIVTPWMENGNISAYLEKNPRANRMRLLHQTSDALAYLHSGRATTIGQVVHGEIQPGSILINHLGDAMLTDFGLSNVLETLELTGPTDTPVNDYFVRFHPPEFFNSESACTTKGDVYSFAMVMLQILSDQVPYADAKNYFAVINNIIKGKLPERPQDEGTTIDDPMWSLLSKCWSYDPEDRPSMEEVRNDISRALRLKLENSPRREKFPARSKTILQPSILDVDE